MGPMESHKKRCYKNIEMTGGNFAPKEMFGTGQTIAGSEGMKYNLHIDWSIFILLRFDKEIFTVTYQISSKDQRGGNRPGEYSDKL